MTKLSTDTIITAGVVAEFPGVAKTAEWNDRVYINLDGFDRSFAGDRNLKIWVRGKRLVIEGRKGCTSSSFDRNLSAFREALGAAATKIYGYGDSIESTWEFA